MKAIILKDYGSVENLIEEDVLKPTPKIDQVLIKVRANSINPIDVKTRKGMGAANWSSINPPFILGWDISGTIENIDKSVKHFKIGDEVFGSIGFPGLGLTNAEYAVANVNEIVLKPKNVSHQEAAAASMAGLTAWQALSRFVTPKKGDRVLIHAASGGVGHIAVQMVKSFGAYVIGTSSSKNKDFIMSLGADEHYDYLAAPFEKNINPVDFVLDTVGRDTTMRSLDVLKTGGALVSILPHVDKQIQQLANKKGVGCFFSLMKSSSKDLESVAEMLFQKKIIPYISQQFKLEELKKAHIQMEQGHTLGKTVINVN